MKEEEEEKTTRRGGKRVRVNRCKSIDKKFTVDAK